ncbi:MAG: hypothetical protein WCT45_01375 [Candidatus Paceibacterota bacterium]|jgi:hypothetical protein
MKKIRITKPSCREGAHHLINYLSVYAYGLETGAQVTNPSFGPWHRYFTLIENETFLTRLCAPLLVLPFAGRIWSVLDSLYGSLLLRVRRACALAAWNDLIYLPPSRPLTPALEACGTAYFVGWFFRNPLGLTRHRDALLAAFRPHERVSTRIERTLAPYRNKTLIGVQVRTLPYRGFPNGEFLVSAARVREVVTEYLREQSLAQEDIVLVITTDGTIDRNAFDGLTICVNHTDPMTSLFLLAQCKAVIGTNSLSSNLAAWFGNAPHIIATNEPVDWEYYRGKTAYFENIYATFAH